MAVEVVPSLHTAPMRTPDDGLVGFGVDCVVLVTVGVRAPLVLSVPVGELVVVGASVIVGVRVFVAVSVGTATLGVSDIVSVIVETLGIGVGAGTAESASQARMREGSRKQTKNLRFIADSPKYHFTSSLARIARCAFAKQKSIALFRASRIGEVLTQGTCGFAAAAFDDRKVNQVLA